MNSLWSFLSQSWPFLMISLALGMCVGAAEIISRYKDEPLIAVRGLAGTSYLILNGIIAMLVCDVLLHYAQTNPALASFRNDPLLTSIIAGLAAMTLMRSKLFTFKGEGGNEYAIGPDVIFTMFLRAIDRNIDRRRVKRRHTIVYEATLGITDSKQAVSFLQSSIASFQNLTQEEREVLNNRVDQISRDTSLDERLKLMRLGFMFLDITGEENYIEFMKRLDLYVADSSRRMQVIYDATAEIQQPIAAIDVLKISLAAFPNLTDQDKIELSDLIIAVQHNPDLSDRLKLIVICTGFLNVSGEMNFKNLMRLIRTYEGLGAAAEESAAAEKHAALLLASRESGIGKDHVG